MIPRLSPSPWLFLVLILSWCGEIQACQTPVFRYAMQHWRPDPYRILVFHRGSLTPGQQAAVKVLEEAGPGDKGLGNYTVETIDLNAGKNKENHPPCPTSVPLPWIMACFPGSQPRELPAWSGALNLENVRLLTDSPVRRELAQRLQQGQTAVSILLESGHRQRDDAAARTLEEILKKLEKTLELPKSLDPGQETPNPTPGTPSSGPETGTENIRISFSVLRVSRKDAAEAALVGMLLNRDTEGLPELGASLAGLLGAPLRRASLLASALFPGRSESVLLDETHPLIFLVFGRGRLLPPLPSAEINPDHVKGAAEFLVGPCSCQIKGAVPGYDLLLMTDWEAPPAPVIQPYLIVPALEAQGLAAAGAPLGALAQFLAASAAHIVESEGMPGSPPAARTEAPKSVPPPLPSPGQIASAAAGSVSDPLAQSPTGEGTGTAGSPPPAAAAGEPREQPASAVAETSVLYRNLAILGGGAVLIVAVITFALMARRGNARN